MIQRETYASWELKDFKTNFKVSPKIELLYAVGGDVGLPDSLIIGRESGKLFYVYHSLRYEYKFQKHPCDVASLRAWLEKKIASAEKEKYMGERSVIYWWRDDIKEFLDGLERRERSGVPERVSGTVQEA